MEFPKVFDKCPLCKCPETLCKLAWEEDVELGKISQASKDMFVSAEKIAVPLVDPKRGVALSVTVLVYHYDVCAKCGHRYCIKAEKTTQPVQMQPGSQFPPRHN